MKAVLLVLVAGAVTLAGCTSGDSTPTGSAGSTVTSTVTNTRDTGTTYQPPKAAVVKPLRPGSDPRAGEQDGSCPYIRTGLDQHPTSKANVADIEGNRIYRTTRLTTLTPVGCRFYFYAPPYNPTAAIEPHTFDSAAKAYNAMILTSRTGKDATSYKNFVPGATGISYRTKFDEDDGFKDWAFVFAKGKVMVVVHTSQPISANARYLARAVAAKF